MLSNKKANINMLPFLLFFIFSPIIGFKFLVTLKAWMLFSVLIVILNVRKKLTMNDAYMLVFIYSVGIFISLVLNIDAVSTFSISFLLSILMFLLLFYSLDILGVNDFRSKFITFIKYYIFLTLAYSLLGFVFYQYNSVTNNTVYYGVFIQHGSPRLSGLVGDPNIAAFYFSILFCFCRILKVESRYLFFCVVIILLTGSRTSLVFLIFCLVLFSAKNVRLFILFISAFIFLFFYLYNIDGFVSPTIFRIGGADSLSRMGGRKELWDEVLKFILDNPLSINGFGNSRLFTKSFKGTETFFHNTFLELTYELGVLFSVFFISVFTYVIFNFKITTSDKVLFSSAIFIFSSSLSLSVNEVFFSAIFILSKLKVISERSEI